MRTVSTAAMTLIEVLISIVLIAVLSGGAYMAYSEHIQEGKEAVAVSTMRKLAEALQAYNSFNPEPYSTSDPRFLIGPYMEDVPYDPWDVPYVIDIFFGRVICCGRDNNLDTFCPFPQFHRPVRTKPNNDDVVVPYMDNGVLCFAKGSDYYMQHPDGSLLSKFLSGFDSVDMASHGSVILYVDSSVHNLHLVLTAENSVTNEVQPMPSPAFVTDGNSIVAIAPDGFNYAVTVRSGALSHVLVQHTTGAMDSASIDSFIVTTTTGMFTGIAWSGNGRELLLIDSNQDTKLMKVAAAARSSMTTFLDHGSQIYNPAWSPDGRFIAYDDGSDTFIVSALTGEPVTSIGGGRAPCFAPDSRKIIFGYSMSGSQREVCACHLYVNSNRIIQLTLTNTATWPNHISWR